MHVLITGIGGTLGKEFAKQLLAQGHRVTGFESNEWAVAQIDSHKNLTVIMNDFVNCDGEYDLIIHTAAYKHVDLIESNKIAAYENNVIKTERFYNNVRGNVVFISTDKAVEPESFYGTTKQEGEELTFDRGGVVVRFGNIMSSSGSVIPKWEQCIAEGKPLPVTDFNMTRYMIPVSEAVKKILKLIEIAKPGQVIIPKMKPPIKLGTLVRKVQKMHNLKDYPIKIIGIRPGEKLHEKLYWDDEIIVNSTKDGLVLERS